MTLPLERARTRKPVTWLTVVGILLLPVVIGGILIAALYNPVERLDSMRAAIVNNDEAITVDGQYIPLGRQLTAGLVEGSDTFDSNLDWTISNSDDAHDGLEDGTYDAVITIPENFSTAAMSTSQSDEPEQATISVETAADSLIVDDAITAQVTQAAAALMGEQLSTVYLENVFLGFTTLGDQLGDAADGAAQLADGAIQLSDGVAQLADGANAAADGAGALPDGARKLADGASELGSGAAQLAGGADSLAGGAKDLADGATQLESGLTTIADKTRDAASGATQLAAGVADGADDLRADGLVPADLTGAASQAATLSTQTADATAGIATGLGGLSAQCAASGAAPEFCSTLATLAANAGDAAAAAGGAQAYAVGTRDGLATFATEAPKELAGQLTTISTNISKLAGGLGQLADGVDQSADGAGSLGDGASQLAGGASGIADGAGSLSSGAGQLSSGAGSLADGAAQLADGVTQLADGTSQLADGSSELADGTGDLANGLQTAVENIPTYTDDEATDLATVLADPVGAEGAGTSLFGASAVPLLAVLALWFGGLGSFIVLQAVPRDALSSRRPSALLALRSLAPAAGIGAVQGLLVAAVVQAAAGYDWGDWSVFAVLAIGAGVSFAAVNQALVAVFGGTGRWIAALVGVLAVATGVVSTVPGILTSIAGLMPTTPAYTAMLAALTPAGGVAAGLVGMIVWALLALLVTVVAVARRRTTSARAILATAPAA